MTQERAEDLVRAAAAAVQQDMIQRPPTPGDGIWRFEPVIEKVIDPKGQSREFWVEMRSVASRLNACKDTWDRAGFGIVASYAGRKVAYATPGFMEAIRTWGGT